MQTEGRQESSNVEDLRGSSGGMGGRPLMVGGGLGGLALVGVVLLGACLFGDPFALMRQGGDPAGQQQPFSAGEEKQKHFVGVVLKDTEDVWNEQFPKAFGHKYKEPKLRLFSGGIESACGYAERAVGPFYCPEDEMVYLDLSFFDELSRKFGAPGDFACAYVVAHEVGHHVQKQLGTLQRVHAEQEKLRRAGKQANANHLSVRLELQADYYAGVWGHYAKKKNLLDPGDLEEALKAAEKIGDDTLQKRAGSRGVMPDKFTHGSSAQRMKWFKKGFDTGDVKGAEELFKVSNEELGLPPDR